MDSEFFFYKCSPESIETIDPALLYEIKTILSQLPRRSSLADIYTDLFWLLASNNWNYAERPLKLTDVPPADLNVKCNIDEIEKLNNHELCTTTLNIKTETQSDFAKSYDRGIVQIEAQFNDLEAAAVDFTKFRVCYAEQRLVLGIEFVAIDPEEFSISQAPNAGEVVSFDQAKQALSILMLDCPILLIGLKN